MSAVDTGGFAGKRALVTGGAGFIGSHLARRLLDCGADVTVVDAMMPDTGANPFNLRSIRDRVHLAEVDVRDASALRPLLVRQDFLFNLAAQVGHLASMNRPAEDLDVNAGALLGMLEICRMENPAIKIVHAGTRQVYGRPDYLPVDERHPLRPVDANGVSKLAADHYCAVYHHVYDARTCVLRLTNTFGPHMRVKDARQTFIGVWIRSLVEGRPFELWGGDQVRDLTFVDDAVDAFCAAALSDESDGAVFNLGGCAAMPLRRLAAVAAEAGGGTFTVAEFPSARRAIDIGDYAGDYRKLTAALGWTPRISIREGIMRTLDFYREHLARYV